MVVPPEVVPVVVPVPPLVLPVVVPEPLLPVVVPDPDVPVVVPEPVDAPVLPDVLPEPPVVPVPVPVEPAPLVAPVVEPVPKGPRALVPALPPEQPAMMRAVIKDTSVISQHRVAFCFAKMQFLSVKRQDYGRIYSGCIRGAT